MANLNATVLSGNTFTHLEVETDRAEVQGYLSQLQHELTANPNAQTFRLQIQRTDVAPALGGGTPIPKGATVVVSLHQHP